MWNSVLHAALPKHGLESFAHCLDVALSRSTAGPEKVLTISWGSPWHWHALQCMLHFRIQRQPEVGAVLQRVQEDRAVTDAVVLQSSHVGNPESIKSKQ